MFYKINKIELKQKDKQYYSLYGTNGNLMSMKYSNRNKSC